MSVNKYDKTTGTLQMLANGTRTWTGSKEAYIEQEQSGTLPNSCVCMITDDEEDYITNEVLEGDERAITSGGVFDAIVVQSNTYLNQTWQDDAGIQFNDIPTTAEIIDIQPSISCCIIPYTTSTGTKAGLMVHKWAGDATFNVTVRYRETI